MASSLLLKLPVAALDIQMCEKKQDTRSKWMLILFALSKMTLAQPQNDLKNEKIHVRTRRKKRSRRGELLVIVIVTNVRHNFHFYVIRQPNMIENEIVEAESILHDNFPLRRNNKKLIP